MQKEGPIDSGWGTPVGGLGGEREGKVLVLEFGECDEERFEAMRGRRPGSEWRWTGEERILEVAHVIADERLGQSGAVSKASEHRPFANPGGGRHGIHRESRGTLFSQEPAGRGEDPPAIRRGVSALRPRLGDGKLDRDPGVRSDWPIIAKRTTSPLMLG